MPVVNRGYARQHGYAYIHDTHDYRPQLPPPRTLHWSKVLSITRHLRHYDAILYLDADCVVQQRHVKVEHYLSAHPNTSVVLTNYAGQGHLWVNAAVVLVRRTDFTWELLRRWWEEGDRAHW